MAIITEATPNPNAMKFTSDKQIFTGDASISIKTGQASEHELLNELIALDHVDNVFGYQHFITINKSSEADWEQIVPKVEAIISNYGY
ncbi:hypothetical protein J2T56_002166 [Natronobacillus azotifigens]|uniref:NifU N-terminal domain-containing protein n=1 Tax=Natronobacillus azotifigens TaxID=472978 RepID=A0A9J6REW2_9BACI|nr:NifU N-terminal domain-containing protein [Natronobacillus azotifigens]MCZ0703934.1 NifU N-terminal domain-containing protein [Natronobacillus azotifigens]